MNTLAWLTRLVAIDTTSRQSNLVLINAVHDWFAQHQVLTRITYNPEQTKANLVASLPAHDGSLTGGLLLSGHTDVVPVDGQPWDTNPFTAVERNGRIYGRGTCDMKGFLAVILALLPYLHQQRLKRPVHFAFSFDEEVGCLGAPLLIKDLQDAGIQPEVCIVGEPTSMQPIIAHKGMQVFRCRVHGRTVHSSLTPQGCNAIEYASSLIHFIHAYGEQIRQNGPFDAAFDVPFTSLSTNMIHGGIAVNAVPADCEFMFEFRHLPQSPAFEIYKVIADFTQQLLPVMQKTYPQARLELENITAVPAFEANDAVFLQQIMSCLGSEAGKKENKVAYATEAGLFQKAGISTLLCGPGSIEQAHRENEYVSIDQLKACESFVKKLVNRLC